MAKIDLKVLAIAGVAAAAIATTAAAHHSYAAFDRTKTVTISGVISELEWTNPHIWVFVNVQGPDKKVVRHPVEGDAPGNMTRRGWTRSAAKVGDKVTLVINPMQNGEPGGHYVTAILPGNKKIERAAPEVAAAPK